MSVYKAMGSDDAQQTFPVYDVLSACCHGFGSFLAGVVVPSFSRVTALASHDSRLTAIQKKLLISSIPFLIVTEISRHAMAPRKKTEEKATANEAADMVLHYLRESLTRLSASVRCMWCMIRSTHADAL